MPGSLRCKLSKLRHKGQITAGEYEELIKKLDGHDKEIRNKAIDEFAEALHKKCDGMIAHTWNGVARPISWARAYADFKDDIDKIAEEMRGAE